LSLAGKIKPALYLLGANGTSINPCSNALTVPTAKSPFPTFNTQSIKQLTSFLI
jgi:hypothetical protein